LTVDADQRSLLVDEHGLVLAVPPEDPPQPTVSARAATTATPTALGRPTDFATLIPFLLT
jgi:hypothetical protein